jgi:hypothetical protein
MRVVPLSQVVQLLTHKGEDTAPQVLTVGYRDRISKSTQAILEKLRSPPKSLLEEVITNFYKRTHT